MTILIVDDLHANRILLEKVVRSHWNCQTSMASDGIEAFEKIKAHRPDLIFLDVVMPQMDGKEFLKQLRSHEDGKSIRVVITTASSDRALVKELGSLGVSGYLLRPFSAEQVVNCIIKTLTLDAPGDGKQDSTSGADKH